MYISLFIYFCVWWSAQAKTNKQKQDNKQNKLKPPRFSGISNSTKSVENIYMMTWFEFDLSFDISFLHLHAYKHRKKIRNSIQKQNDSLQGIAKTEHSIVICIIDLEYSISLVWYTWFSFNRKQKMDCHYNHNRSLRTWQPPPPKKVF